MDIASPAFQLEEIERASAAFEAAIDGDLGTDIEFIEGWSVRDLVAHLGAVYAMAAANVRAATEERTAPGDEAQAPEGEAIAAWFGERRTDLLQALNDAPVDQVAASHAGVQTAGWWRRRLMHETIVHLWDLQTATGTPDPIDGDMQMNVNSVQASAIDVSDFRVDSLFNLIERMSGNFLQFTP